VEAIMNPRYQKYVARLESLIKEGAGIASSPAGEFGHIRDVTALSSWETKLKNILVTVFGDQSIHYKQYLTSVSNSRATTDYDVNLGVGVLLGALDDLQGGYLTAQEFITAGAVFDTVLQQATYLNDHGFKDAAAVLMRIALEDAIKRIAASQGHQVEGVKAAVLNDRLKDVVYPQAQWRLNASCLDTGNDAAHGDFDKYTETDVKARIEDVERFLAAYFIA
jgi:hypothetical protein